MLLYFRTGSRRARQNIKLQLHNEGRLATEAGGQKSGFDLCNSNKSPLQAGLTEESSLKSVRGKAFISPSSEVLQHHWIGSVGTWAVGHLSCTSYLPNEPNIFQGTRSSQ